MQISRGIGFPHAALTHMGSMRPEMPPAPAASGWALAVVPPESIDDASIGEYGLLNPPAIDDPQRPLGGLLGDLGTRTAQSVQPESSALFGAGLWQSLLWRISNDQDGDERLPPQELYAEYYRLRRALADWRVSRDPHLLKEAGRTYYPEVRELIERIATATSEEEQALRAAIEQMPRFDRTTRNQFHVYLSNRLDGDPEDSIRSALLEESEAGLIETRSLRDEYAKAYARSFMRLPSALLEMAEEGMGGGMEGDAGSTLTPKMRLELRYSLDAMLMAMELYQAALIRLRQAPSDSRRRNLVQMNLLSGTTYEVLHEVVARAENRMPGPGINFRAPSGMRYPDGSIAPDGTVTNVEVKPDERRVRSQVEKDEWAAKNLGIKTEYTYPEDLIRRAKRLLGEE